jgi:hypothetical protein
MKGIGINVISFFIRNSTYGFDDETSKNFRRMYGNTAEFVDSTSLIKIASTLNRKFLEVGETV